VQGFPRLLAHFAALALALFATAANAGEKRAAARFLSFSYAGEDEALRDPPAGSFVNPVLTGFYPDPSVTTANGRHYLVNSTFCYFPGIPVHESADLVSWKQIGSAIDRDGMLDCSGLGLSRGVFAPTISFDRGMFYIANTCVDCGGNFVVTARDPAGPWSDPIWMPHVGGIDPSIFFDDDGKVYVLNNDEPPAAALYDGHRAIYIREVDRETFAPRGEARVLIDGGVRPEEKPIWIEGPHIFKRDGWYYLSAAEGGTAEGHSQVVLRGKGPLGPFKPYADNPILTQRDLPRDRPFPVTSVGHADLTEDAAGRTWAIFLGTRPYEGDHYNTGRETFLLPVTWKNGWPIILPRGEPVPYALERPAALQGAAPGAPSGGNFSYVDEFDGPALAPQWLSLRAMPGEWLRLEGGAAQLTLTSAAFDGGGAPAFLARRQQHMHAAAETRVAFRPRRKGEEAGLALFQNEEHYYALVIVGDGKGRRVELRRRAGQAAAETIASAPIGKRGDVRLRAEARGDTCAFFIGEGDGAGAWRAIGEPQDARTLSTRTAGGFVGAVFALFAQAAH